MVISIDWWWMPVSAHIPSLLWWRLKDGMWIKRINYFFLLSSLWCQKYLFESNIYLILKYSILIIFHQTRRGKFLFIFWCDARASSDEKAWGKNWECEWHRWLDTKFSLNSTNFNYFTFICSRRSTHWLFSRNNTQSKWRLPVPGPSYLQSNTTGSEALPDYDSIMGFLSMNILFVASVCGIMVLQLQNQYRFHAGSWFGNKSR